MSTRKWKTMQHFVGGDIVIVWKLIKRLGEIGSRRADEQLHASHIDFRILFSLYLLPLP